MFYYMIIIGLAFGYMNGMHDGGTVVATTISSRLLTPTKAVCVAGIANFLGAIALGTAVAYTISENIIDIRPILSGSKSLCYAFVAAAFTGSMIWNVLTWVLKLPSSASHSMIGAMIGSGICAYGLPYIQWNSIMLKVIAAMLLSPVLGFAAGYLFLRLLSRLLRNGTIVWNHRIQLLHKGSSFFLAFCYGSNDAQKVMGLIAIGIAAFHHTDVVISLWLIVSASCALAIGTMTGGYNMIKTVGMDICKIDMQNSFSSQLSTIFVVMLANVTGLPISATQVVTSSVMGVGASNTPKSVNWTITKKILLAWLITIPVSALIGGLVCWLFQLI
ncbi:inorganic phosphate transporter [Emergencia sp. JLR.KK010]|uniref:inorganic phosphate transporter n=1 Tax=Emergencia sp. JLR.KK010 TaxID=3114296 RepID=UPI0030D4C5B4